ncbi:class I SAM-dependent methyltransferase [Acidovorax sp. LjRoot129]|uniref:class I SAM-dependent methyltransferase n=1 Tax=Acidovorax sp. LjRoot129 TaxID=3342260 RepID=UPI003ECF4F7C
MKGRESGMPDEAYWVSFFDPEAALGQLFSDSRECEKVVEFGCGYGTFTLPAARRASGIVTALDIETDLLEIVARKADAARLGNVRVALRDFVAEGTGLDNGTQSHAMIFNLLHLEDPVALLREAYRVLQHGGSLSVIHWRRDIPTPRGPSLSIRPSPQQCRTWMEEAGFRSVHSVDLEGCCPYHFGLVGCK